MAYSVTMKNGKCLIFSMDGDPMGAVEECIANFNKVIVSHDKYIMYETGYINFDLIRFLKKQIRFVIFLDIVLDENWNDLFYSLINYFVKYYGSVDKATNHLSFKVPYRTFYKWKNKENFPRVWCAAYLIRDIVKIFNYSVYLNLEVKNELL